MVKIQNLDDLTNFLDHQICPPQTCEMISVFRFDWLRKKFTLRKTWEPKGLKMKKKKRTHTLPNRQIRNIHAKNHENQSRTVNCVTKTDRQNAECSTLVWDLTTLSHLLMLHNHCGSWYFIFLIDVGKIFVIKK